MPKQKKTMGAKKSRTAAISDSGPHKGFDYREGWAYVNLRIPSTMLQDLDQHLSLQAPKIHRMHWIIQAIVEKMERDRKAIA